MEKKKCQGQSQDTGHREVSVSGYNQPVTRQIKMMLRGAIGPQSLVIIQSEITDSESNVWLHLVVY